MRRRDFIKATVGVVTAWPVAARAEQSAMPVIGYLGGSSPAYRGHLLTAFWRGIRESGFVEGENVTIEYRWAQDQYDRLPDLAADLVRRHVQVIAATDTPSATAAKAATTMLPIVFASGADPVKEGLVTSLNRPKWQRYRCRLHDRRARGKAAWTVTAAIARSRPFRRTGGASISDY
jgi:putative ABC transport system substrate-binding protein